MGIRKSELVFFKCTVWVPRTDLELRTKHFETPPDEGSGRGSPWQGIRERCPLTRETPLEEGWRRGAPWRGRRPLAREVGNQTKHSVLCASWLSLSSLFAISTLVSLLSLKSKLNLNIFSSNYHLISLLSLKLKLN